MKELRPLVDEYERLSAAAAALDGVGGSRSSTATAARPARAARKSTRSRAASSAAGGPKRGRGRPKGSGTRAKEALELVSKNPGITIPEIATSMGIKQNYLYRVLPGLQKDGLVRKEGRGWHAKAAA